MYNPLKPALVAQLDACLTGNQEVARLIPAGRQNSFVEIWSWNIFYGHSLPSTDSRRAVMSVSDERVRTILVNRLED